MAKKIDTDANISRIRLAHQTSHPSAPTSGFGYLYLTTGTANGRLVVEDPSGNKYTFLTGSVSGRVLIEEKTPSGTATVAFTAIPQTYKKLTIEYIARSTVADTYADLTGYFNNDKTAGNYQNIRNYAYGLNSSGIDTLALTLVPGNTAPANSFGSGKIDVIQYANTVNNKEFFGDGLAYRDTSSIRLLHCWGATEWKDASAVTRIDIDLSSGNYVFGSVLRLYGEN